MEKETMSVEMLKSLVDSKIKRLDEVIALEVNRVDALRESEIRRINESMIAHALFNEKLAEAEAKRLDAIRSIDAATTVSIQEKTAAQALALAKTLEIGNDTLRNLVASTASTITEQLKSVATQLADRLLVVEKTQYELKGKSVFTDPNLGRIEALEKIEMGHKGEEGGRKDMMGWIMAGVSTLIAIASIIFAIVKP
jgi:hypothetical protein